jgi:hypothetical protein
MARSEIQHANSSRQRRSSLAGDGCWSEAASRTIASPSSPAGRFGL